MCIRILQVGFSSNPGGVENLVMGYYRHINRERVQFDFLDLYGDGIAFEQEIKEFGGEIYTLPNYKRHPIQAYKEMVRIISEKEYKIIHIHMQSAANLLPHFAGLKSNSIVIAHSHSSSTPKGTIRKILNFFNVGLLRNLPVVKCACGIKAGKWMWGETFDSNFVIPNSIEMDRFVFNPSVRNEIRLKCGFNETDKVIGFVGRFGDEKNVFFLIKVLKELRDISKDYKLLTVGGNGLYEDFVKEIQKDGLEDAFYSAGIQKSTSEWYQAMDAFLLPSFFEGFPVVGVEAQTSGLYCFFSNRISDEIYLSTKSEFLTIDEVQAAKLWARKIDTALSIDNDRKAIISDLYNIDIASKNIEKLYLKIDCKDNNKGEVY